MERTVQLPGGPLAARAARDVVDSLSGSLPTSVQEDLKLLVSEVVTNSVRHGGAADTDRIDLTVLVSEGVVRVDVIDQGPGFVPGRPTPRPDRTSGFGLVLVDRLTERWGVEGHRPTRVWFEIAARGDGGARRRRLSVHRQPVPA